jgi:hypothetical protein
MVYVLRLNYNTRSYEQVYRMKQTSLHMCRVGQNRIYAPYMTVYWDIPCQKFRIYTIYIYGSGQPYTCAVSEGAGGLALHNFVFAMVSGNLRSHTHSS